MNFRSFLCLLFCLPMISWSAVTSSELSLPSATFPSAACAGAGGAPAALASVGVSPLGISIMSEKEGTGGCSLATKLGGLHLASRDGGISAVVRDRKGRARSDAVLDANVESSSDTIIPAVCPVPYPPTLAAEYFQKALSLWRSPGQAPHIVGQEILYFMAQNGTNKVDQYRAAFHLYNADIHLFDRFIGRFINAFWENFWKDFESRCEVFRRWKALEPSCRGITNPVYINKYNRIHDEMEQKFALFYEEMRRFEEEKRLELRCALQPQIAEGRRALYKIIEARNEKPPHPKWINALYFLASSLYPEDRSFALALLKDLKMAPFNEGKESFLAAGDSDKK